VKLHEVRVQKPGRPPAREDQLAWKLAAMAADPAPVDDAAAETAIDRIIDNAAVALAAINRTPVANARSQALAFPREGGATVFGLPSTQRFACGWAAWANSSAVRELDFHDNFFAEESSHPGDNISSVIAVAQQCGRSGEDLVRGIVTAYEIQIDLAKGIALNPYRIDHVAHLGPAIAGGVGALLGLDAAMLYQAIQHAAHVSVATRQGRKGDISSWKANAPGHVGKAAIEAVDRAMRGETSPSPIYEGDYGILAILLGGPEMVCQVPLPEKGEAKRAILETYAKQHSAGYHGQALIDLAFRMREKIEDFEAIESVTLHSKRLTHVVMGSGAGDPEKWDPKASRETLDHSAMFIFAVALQDGEWHHERSYAPERVSRPDTLLLWKKVQTVEDAEWTRRYTEPAPLDKDHGARAVIRFTDGRELVDEIAVANAHPRGARPFGRADYIEKFRTLTAGIVEKAEAERFLDVAQALRRLPAERLGDLNVAVPAERLLCRTRDRRGIF
jgi:2-methylcitrate dehydratase